MVVAEKEILKQKIISQFKNFEERIENKQNHDIRIRLTNINVYYNEAGEFFFDLSKVFKETDAAYENLKKKNFQVKIRKPDAEIETLLQEWNRKL